MNIDDIIKQSRDGVPASKDQLLWMLELQPSAPETYLIMAEARRVSAELTENQAEVHAQLALNLEPCPADCGFCSFAQVNGIFTDSVVIDPELAVDYATQMLEARPHRRIGPWQRSATRALEQGRCLRQRQRRKHRRQGALSLRACSPGRAHLDISTCTVAE